MPNDDLQMYLEQILRQMAMDPDTMERESFETPNVGTYDMFGRPAGISHTGPRNKMGSKNLEAINTLLQLSEGRQKRDHEKDITGMGLRAQLGESSMRQKEQEHFEARRARAAVTMAATRAKAAKDELDGLVKANADPEKIATAQAKYDQLTREAEDAIVFFEAISGSGPAKPPPGGPAPGPASPTPSTPPSAPGTGINPGLLAPPGAPAEGSTSPSKRPTPYSPPDTLTGAIDDLSSLGIGVAQTMGKNSMVPRLLEMFKKSGGFESLNEEAPRMMSPSGSLDILSELLGLLAANAKDPMPSSIGGPEISGRWRQ